MSDIEEEIRQRILAERTADGGTVNRPAAAPGPPPVPPPGPPNGAHPYYAAPPPPVNPSMLQKQKQKGGLVGAIATVLLVLAKIGAPVLVVLAKLKFLLIGFKLLTFGKLFLTFGSMLLSMWLYATLFGWRFGVGIVLLIFIHECGHALAARMRGIPTSLMVFVPFMGAFVASKRGGRNITEDAFIGIMGPVIGTLACVACVGIYAATGSFIWLALASWGFFVNLFNLLPTPPLDGGWIVPLFSPKLMAIGVVLLFVFAWRNPMIWVLLVFSIPRIISGWKADPKTQPYFQATSADRWKYGLAYFGLAAFLGMGYFLLNGFLHTHYPVAA